MNEGSGYLLKRSILEATAEAWNECQIRYAVIHGAELPDVLGRDLDVLVEQADFERALEITVSIMKSKGWSPVVHRKPWAVWIVSFLLNDDETYAVEIDLLSEMQWGWTTLINGITVNEKHRFNSLFRVDGWGGFVKRIVIQILSNNIHRLKRKENDFQIYPWEEEIVPQKLNYYLGDKLAHGFIDAINGKNEFWFHTNMLALRCTFLYKALIHYEFGILRASWKWLNNEFRQVFFPKRVSPIVAFVGPDGVGKSTLVNAIKQIAAKNLIFTNIQIKHWRPNVLPPLDNFVKNSSKYESSHNVLPNRIPGKFYLLRILYYAVDFFWGYLIRDRISSSRLELILYDRCFLDMVVDPLRFGMSSVVGLKMLWRVLPKPDLIIFLRDSPERIHMRKNELPVQEIKRQLNEWEKLVNDGKIHIAVDVEKSPEEMAKCVIRSIKESFVRMNLKSGSIENYS